MIPDFKKEWKGVVAVIGASEINKDIEQKTIEIGRLLAKNKFIVSCGGLSGAMEAVCKGAKQEGGITIGIIPFKKKSAANRYVDIAIPVPFSQARNIVVVLSGDVVVAIAGKAGTLSEISFSWIYGKPIVALRGVGGWSSKMAGEKLDDRRSDQIYSAETPLELVQKVIELMREKRPRSFNFSEI